MYNLHLEEIQRYCFNCTKIIKFQAQEQRSQTEQRLDCIFNANTPMIQRADPSSAKPNSLRLKQQTEPPSKIRSVTSNIHPIKKAQNLRPISSPELQLFSRKSGRCEGFWTPFSGIRFELAAETRSRVNQRTEQFFFLPEHISLRFGALPISAR